jgi:hypothetical protein
MISIRCLHLAEASSLALFFRDHFRESRKSQKLSLVSTYSLCTSTQSPHIEVQRKCSPPKSVTREERNTTMHVMTRQHDLHELFEPFIRPPARSLYDFRGHRWPVIFSTSYIQLRY